MLWRFIISLFIFPFGMVFVPALALSEDRRIEVVTLDFPPYVGEGLLDQGWAWEVCSRVLRDQGYRPELVLMPWARAVNRVKTGQSDALYMANINEERKSWAAFSDPVGEEVSVVFSQRNKQPIIETIANLSGIRTGGLRDSHVTRKMMEHGVAVYQLTSMKQGVRMLYLDRLDAVVMDRFVGLHLIRTQFPEGYQQVILPMDYAVDRNGLHLAISRKTPGFEEIRQRFNEGLAKLRATGGYQRILQKHGF